MNGRYMFGALLVLAGTIFFLDKMGIWDASQVVSTWWPVLIVLIGVSQLASSHKSILSGAIITVFGLLLLADQLTFLPGGIWATFWPLLLIALGVWILTARYKRNRIKSMSTDLINFFTMFGGIKQMIESQDFKGGAVTCFFGGADIDLRRAKLSSEGGLLEIMVTFGGVTLKIPTNWNVLVSGTPLVGGCENKLIQDFSQNSFTPTLTIHYTAIFGGVELKN